MTLSFFYCFRSKVVKSESIREGYLDSFNHTHQEFYRDTFLCIGEKEIRISRKLLFREEIPQHVVHAFGCIGDTGWRSDCPADILDKCTRRAREAA